MCRGLAIHKDECLVYVFISVSDQATLSDIGMPYRSFTIGASNIGCTYYTSLCYTTKDLGHVHVIVSLGKCNGGVNDDDIVMIVCWI